MRSGRRPLTYANVVSSLALFLALGGAATAATVVIKSSKQVAKGAINSGDVADNSLTSADLKNGAGVGLRDLTSAAVAGLKGKQGPAGPQGATGPQGSRGPQGDPGVVPSPETPQTVETFLNSWAFYDSGTVATTDDQPVRFWKDFSGVVHLEGAVTNPGAPSDGSAIFRLPDGYRLAENYANFAVLTTGFSDFNEVLGAINIAGKGTPSIDGTVTYEGGTPGYVSLDGITFRAG